MEWVSGNVYIRPNKLAKAGDRTAGHAHRFDHTSIIFKGSVRITARLPNGTEIMREAAAPAHFLIKAEVHHEIVALEDGTEYWCVYSHRTPQGDVTEDYNGWDKAYV